MANYRRAGRPGGTFFPTVVTFRQRFLFDRPESRLLLGKTVQTVRQRHPFVVHARVLLPEHMHCIGTLPQDNSDFSVRWSLIKSGFSRRAKALCHIEDG